jgi:alpha-L-rhamnosidase
VTLEDQWGAALRYGGTTTFEMFRPSAADVLGPNDPPPNGQCGMTSLCHPWGAGVCQYLNEVVAGIVPTSPGFTTVDVMPHLGRRLTSAAVVTPTPHGPVLASVDVEAGTGRVVLPAGVRGRIGIPKVERRITRITVNSRLAWDGTYHAVAGIDGATEDTEFVIFEGVAAGTYEFQVARRGATPAPRGTAMIYPVRCLGEDRRTRGNWAGVHGRDGHVLPAYDGVGSDVRVLPPWVRDVVLERGAQVVWAAGVDDERAPVRGPDDRGPRTAAAVLTKDPEPTYQTMTADIAADTGREYTLSLYFLDWDDRGRSVGVQIIDPTSLKQLAPVQVVRSFREGIYLSYRCRGPVRVRVDTITPPNAVLSGIFFSS